jgi:hypothetical protein
MPDVLRLLLAGGDVVHDRVRGEVGEDRRPPRLVLEMEGELIQVGQVGGQGLGALDLVG